MLMYPYTTSDKPLISLALQGIGHGAFTWGVMDALMESDSVRFRDIAATGSDTITALLAVYGLRTGGATKARTLMRNFWTGLDSMAVWGPVDLAWAHMAVTGEPPPENLTQLKVASPGEPMSTEEVYVVLEDLYKPAVFAGEHGPVLHLCTMEADTGNLFVFTGRDISYESAMAASCLSELSPAITVGNRDYWSAHILGHAALSALIHASRSEDVVLLNANIACASALPFGKSLQALTISTK
jgi:NTE family protein